MEQNQNDAGEPGGQSRSNVGLGLVPVAWMSQRIAGADPDANYRRLQLDYEYSGGYGLRSPDGWEPLVMLAQAEAMVAAERERWGKVLRELRGMAGLDADHCALIDDALGA